MKKQQKYFKMTDAIHGFAVVEPGWHPRFQKQPETFASGCL
jgi:hypothetical protein